MTPNRHALSVQCLLSSKLLACDSAIRTIMNAFELFNSQFRAEANTSVVTVTELSPGWLPPSQHRHRGV